MFLQSFARAGRKPNVVALGRTVRHDNVNVKHAGGDTQRVGKFNRCTGLVSRSVSPGTLWRWLLRRFLGDRIVGLFGDGFVSRSGIFAGSISVIGLLCGPYSRRVLTRHKVSQTPVFGYLVMRETAACIHSLPLKWPISRSLKEGSSSCIACEIQSGKATMPQQEPAASKRKPR